MRGHIPEKITAVSCALVITFCVIRATGPVQAEDTPGEMPAQEASFVVLDVGCGDLPAEEGTSVSPYAAPSEEDLGVTLVVNGQTAGECTVVNARPYVSAERFCQALGLSVTARTEGDVYTLSGDVTLRAEDGDEYFTCCGHYLYAESGVMLRNNQALVPVEELAACLCVPVAWDRSRGTVEVRADAVPLPDGDYFYDETDLYWLSRLIYAEAGSESLREQLAVGDVVLNRVSALGQADVYSVIFAKNAFDVVVNGMIYMQPDEEAEVAAMLALEGYDITDGATLYADSLAGEGYECTVWIDDLCFMKEVPAAE